MVDASTGKRHTRAGAAPLPGAAIGAPAVGSWFIGVWATGGLITGAFAIGASFVGALLMGGFIVSGRPRGPRLPAAMGVPMFEPVRAMDDALPCLMPRSSTEGASCICSGRGDCTLRYRPKLAYAAE